MLFKAGNLFVSLCVVFFGVFLCLGVCVFLSYWFFNYNFFFLIIDNFKFAVKDKYFFVEFKFEILPEAYTF